jgi:hypothetical protein
VTDDPKALDRAVRASLIQSKSGAMRRLAKEWPPAWGPPPGAMELSDRELMQFFDAADQRHALLTQYADDPARLWWIHVLCTVYSAPLSQKRIIEEELHGNP